MNHNLFCLGVLGQPKKRCDEDIADTKCLDTVLFIKSLSFFSTHSGINYHTPNLIVHNEFSLLPALYNTGRLRPAQDRMKFDYNTGIIHMKNSQPYNPRRHKGPELLEKDRNVVLPSRQGENLKELLMNSSQASDL